MMVQLVQVDKMSGGVDDEPGGTAAGSRWVLFSMALSAVDY
jgi:hypothetical protein